jgi:hypothetical protein
MWGVGIVQEVDAAAMSFWLTYRHLEADVTSKGHEGYYDYARKGSVATEGFQYIKFGALINF